jgi:hypothetical protein
MAIKYTNIVHCKTLQNLPEFGFFIWKYASWQPCPDACSLDGVQRANVQDRCWAAPGTDVMFFKLTKIAENYDYNIDPTEIV